MEKLLLKNKKLKKKEQYENLKIQNMILEQETKNELRSITYINQTGSSEGKNSYSKEKQYQVQKPRKTQQVGQLSVCETPATSGAQ